MGPIVPEGGRGREVAVEKLVAPGSQHIKPQGGAVGKIRLPASVDAQIHEQGVVESVIHVQAGSAALRIISLGFIISAVSVIACGVLEGLGMGFPSLVISLLRYVLCIIPAAFVLSRLWGVNGVWHAFWATEVLATLVSWQICCRKVFARRQQAE